MFGISFCNNVPRRIDTTATGPMAICLELPSAAYISGGTKLESANHNKRNKGSSLEGRN